eukprot:g1265.t1
MVHLPGKRNVVADSRSRLEFNSEVSALVSTVEMEDLSTDKVYEVSHIQAMEMASGVRYDRTGLRYSPQGPDHGICCELQTQEDDEWSYEGKPSRIDLFPKRRNTKEVEQDKAKLLKQQAQEHQAAGLLTTVSQFFHSPRVHLNGKSADFKFDPSKLNKVVMEPMCEHPLGNEAKEEDWGLVEREDGKSAVLSTEKNNDLDTTHSGQEESEEESEDEIVHF